MQYSRIVLLARENMKFVIMEEWMDPSISSIWLKLGGRGLKNLYVGGGIQGAYPPESG